MHSTANCLLAFILYLCNSSSEEQGGDGKEDGWDGEEDGGNGQDNGGNGKKVAGMFRC